MVVAGPAEVTTVDTWAQLSPPGQVSVSIVKTSYSSRKLEACVSIQAPVDVVWDALTDYDNLGTFIPSLVENRCLERRSDGAVLYQVTLGGQQVHPTIAQAVAGIC